MSQHPLRELIALAAAGRTPPTRDELHHLGCDERQVDAVVAAAAHAANLHAAGAHAAARSVAYDLATWFPGDLASVGTPPPVDPLAEETDPRRLAAAVGKRWL